MKPYPKAAGTLADSAHADGAPADGVHAGGALADDALAGDVADDDFADGAFADDALAGEAAVGEASANEIAHGDQDMTTLMQASRLQMTHLLLLSCVLPPPAGATFRQTTGEETAIDQTTLRYELLDTPEVSLFSV